MVCSEWSTVGKPTRVFAQELGLLFCPRFYYDYIRNNISEYDIYSNMNIHIINILWVTGQVCASDEVAKCGRTGITRADTEDMLSRERTHGLHNALLTRR